jgi:hypothetical protein
MSAQPASRPAAENWENEGGSLPQPTEVEALGITRFLGESYVVGGYSYTRLADAVAQGRRMRSAGTGL